MELFSRDGLEAVTVEHIADMADVGKGTIYNYFPAKEDIIVAFMAELERRIQTEVARLAPTADSLEDLLNAFVRHQFQLKAPHHAFVRVMLGQMFQRTEEFRPYMAEMQKAIDPNLDRLFRGARARDLVAVEVTAPEFIFAFKTLQLGLTAVWAIEGPPFRLADQVTKSAIRFFCKGLGRATS